MSDLNGKRVLVVEDEYFIAKDITRILRESGVEVIGPVGTLADGLRLAGGGELDGAVLDVNLDGVASYPIVDRLRSGGVPHLFLTGYDDWSLPHEHRQAPRLGKPFGENRLVAAVGDLLRPMESSV